VITLGFFLKSRFAVKGSQYASSLFVAALICISPVGSSAEIESLRSHSVVKQPMERGTRADHGANLSVYAYVQSSITPNNPTAGTSELRPL
jgi:hypothetical protein